MTNDQARDLHLQSLDFWRTRGGSEDPHNVKPGAIHSRRALGQRAARRKWSRFMREVTTTPPRRPDTSA